MPYDKYVGEHPKAKPAPPTKHYDIKNVGVYKDKKGKVRSLF